MPLGIKQDQARFRDIVRGKVRAGLREYVRRGELIGRQGGELVSIPLPSVELPRLRFSDRAEGGVGQGEGVPGQPLPGPPGAEAGGGAGPGEGTHLLEVEVALDELADLLGEELALPRIRPRGADRTVSDRTRYTGTSSTGPESLRHLRRTYRRALLRAVAGGTYDPSRPVVVPIHEDRRYLTWKAVPRPETSAAILYLMDVSGSMGDEQKELVRLTAFWLDTWLRRHYRGLATRYLVHDVAAREVDREAFFHTRESGGTRISSAYQLALELVERDHPPDAWNTYVFHFSDGDNEGGQDTSRCVELLRDRLLPAVNLFGYGQVGAGEAPGQHLEALRAGLGERPEVVLASLPDREAVLGCLRAFLGTGR